MVQYCESPSPSWRVRDRCRKTIRNLCYAIGRLLIETMILSIAIRALADDRRQKILEWLKNPTKHFSPQVAGDLVEDGVCGYLIARKLRVSQLTLSEHMKILCQAGLTRPKRIERRTFYKRDESVIRKIKKMILSKV
jgi:DNA-binding transcriptional ArsR family regulator